MIKISMEGTREFFLTYFLSRTPNHSRRIQQLQLFSSAAQTCFLFLLAQRNLMKKLSFPLTFAWVFFVHWSSRAKCFLHILWRYYSIFENSPLKNYFLLLKSSIFLLLAQFPRHWFQSSFQTHKKTFIIIQIQVKPFHLSFEADLSIWASEHLNIWTSEHLNL